MAENSSIISSYSSGDEAILKTLGAQLRQMRLNRNYTQQQLAKLSGVSRSTIGGMENGNMGAVLSLVQVLRALEKLEILNAFITEAPVSPLQIAKMRGKTRKRASGKTDIDDNNSSGQW